MICEAIGDFFIRLETVATPNREILRDTVSIGAGYGVTGSRLRPGWCYVPHEQHQHEQHQRNLRQDFPAVRCQSAFLSRDPHFAPPRCLSSHDQRELICGCTIGRQCGTTMNRSNTPLYLTPTKHQVLNFLLNGCAQHCDAQ